jgi:RNA polymerase sigma-70 factor (ECF subfamily)
MFHEKTLHLVRSAQQGSPQALEALFKRYLPRVRQIVALRLGYRQASCATIDDLVQEALLRVFQNLEQFAAQSEASFRHWIATCVANSVRNTLRDARAEKRGGQRVRVFAELFPESLASSIFPGKGPTASAILQGAETLEKIEAALLSLEECDRELIILRRLCEMSYREVADKLGLSEVAARQAFHRAMARLEQASGLDRAAGGGEGSR